jgi:O-acetyl-ADP-ribose deacetylase (regulator of RNase III)
MNQQERRNSLIRYLLDEDPQYRDIRIPASDAAQKQLLRALMNVRMPKEADPEFLAIQDAYLQEELKQKGITDFRELKPLQKGIYLWQGDITLLACDAIVNAANSAMCGCFVPNHTCIDNILGSKAGIELRLFTNDIITRQGYPEPTGQAKITPGFNLPSKYIIHTVGPIVQGRLTKENERMLASCYRSILELADQNDIKTLALCCISTGVFMFPNQRAAEIAVETVRKYLEETGSQIKVIFNVFKDIDLMLYRYYLGEADKVFRTAS